MEKARVGRMIKFILVSIYSVTVAMLSLEWYFFSIIVAGILVWVYSETREEAK